MEALLPSEIARLVFGYLEDQKCDDAARSFLEASPHLQECRTAVLGGRRFNTRVNGYTLVDIFDKFSAAHSLVQERLSKVADCEQVKQCGDLLEQLRFLIGGSRGQRFVVNINVPSQANSQTYGGSPIITSSIRKRNHSGSDRDRTKRTQKPLHQLFEKQPEPVSSQLGCDNVEATPLESLPGHANLSIPSQHEHAVTQDSDGVYCTSTKNDFTDSPALGDSQISSKQICHNPRMSHQGIDRDNSSRRSERYSPVLVLGKEKMEETHVDDEENRDSVHRGKTTATSTDELTTYSSIEVQTTPYALSESESIGLDDEPIENLSLLTKELLNRTELQERIAENINKAILPIEMPSKDESICESMGGELNTSIMAELNNAIKSIVAATETDPIFEHFLDEIIGPNVDTDTSPDEDPDIKVASQPATDSRNHAEPSNTAVVDMDLEEESTVTCNKGISLIGATEVPLKQRLRSSSRQQTNKQEDDGDKPKDVDKTDSSLEDHNAAAILSIINANIVSDKQIPDKGSVVGINAVAKPGTVVQSSELSQAGPISSESRVADSTEVVENKRSEDCKKNEKPIAKKPLSSKSNPQPKIDEHELITEQEMMAMPTLIVCSQEEMPDCINADSLYSSGKAVPCSDARFVPIAPKGSDELEPIKPLYLKTVQVPIKIPTKMLSAKSDSKVQTMKMKPQSPPRISGASRKRNRKVTKKSKNLKPAIIPTNAAVDPEPSLTINKDPVSHAELESITLYANDNSFGTMIETGHMPAINLDDSMTLTGIGLSPYLKFHDSKNLSEQAELPSTKPIDQVLTEELDPRENLDLPIILPHTENILITRRTPKSILKSRSKNNRLSMSTPRRRSSHIRALNFNTPTKSSSSEHKGSGNESLQFSSKSSKRARSVCRTSLFKSPPFSSTFAVSQKGKSPVKNHQLYKVPIATRSPAPKLMGGWEKYTGVGMILGGTSPHPSSSSSFFAHEEPDLPVKSSSCGVKKSWDADLRQALQDYQEPTCSTSVVKKGPAKVKGRAARNCGADVEEKVPKSRSSESCDQSEHVNTQKKESTKINDQIDNKEANSVRDDVFDTTGEAKNNSETMKEVKSFSASVNVELGRREIANLGLQDERATIDKIEIVKSNTKIKENVISEIDGKNKAKDTPIVKKYAKLKTLETKISKYKKGQITESPVSCSVDSSQKLEYLKISPEIQSQSGHMSRMIDLETPRKIDNCIGIPPTPRLLSPSSSTITPFTKIAEELSKVPSFISTPDFPPTPSIALTPKVMGENTIDAIKKGDYGTCSPYYQPSNEQPDILEKLINAPSNLKENTTEVLPATTSTNMETRAVNESRGVASDFVMSTSSSKLEITQFEVIKENLPKEHADKELKISASSRSTEETLPKLESNVPSEAQEPEGARNVNEKLLNHEASSSSSGNESSDSSSSDTSSSSSCSTSCSCSSIATTSTPFKSVMKCKIKSNTHREASNDCSSRNLPVTTIDHNLLSEISPITAQNVFNTSENNKSLVAMQTASSFPRGETSPVKLMPIIKTQEEVDASAKETPAKDEALLSEANISETPSSSKSGIESLTNLNSKISALDNAGEQGSLRHSHSANKTHVPPPTRAKPKVISVQHFLPDVSVALKPPLVSEMVSSTTQSCNNLSTLSAVALDGKLGTHLEEKRRRLMAKLKNKPQPKIIAQKVKVTKLNTKFNYKSKSSGHERKTSTNQSALHDPAVKRITQISETKEVSVKNTKIKSKQKSENPTDRKRNFTQSNSTLVKSTSKERKYDKCSSTATSTTQSVIRKSTSVERQQSSIAEQKDDGESLIGKKITREENREVIRKKEESSVETSDINIRSQGSGDLVTTKIDSRDCATIQLISTTEITKDLAVSSNEMKSTHSTKLTSSATQNFDRSCKKDATEKVNTVKDELPKLLPSCSEDEESGVEHVTVPIKKSQIVPMSKVDQIKRDLFSDEENSEQRTTRSRTRLLSDAQKNDSVVPGSESLSQSEIKACQSIAKKPKEELATVLECLNLVPANKNETVEKTSSSPKSSVNKFVEYEFVYDDSIPLKKKRVKFSSSNLQYVINVELRDENYRECPRLMTSTNYEEIFNISPKPKKRVAKKLPVKSSKPTKTEIPKATGGVGTILKNELIKPLLSSTTGKLKTLLPKVSKTTTKIHQKNVKPTDKDDKKKPKDDNQVLKKRKMTDSDEEQSDEKKRRIADPQALLKKLDLDRFLNSVHGPV